MKDLASFLIENITGSNDFSIEEEVDGERVILNVTANPDIVGLIIGKEGKTIKNIRRIVAIKAALNDQAVNISVTEA